MYDSLTEFYVFILLVVGYILFKFYDRLSDYLKREKDRKEFDGWLRDIEPIQRDIHAYPEDWGMRRRYIASQFKHTCQICGRVGWLGFHVHHKKKLTEGGTNALENLIYLCKYCHENQHEHMQNARKKINERIAIIRKKTYWKHYWERKRARENNS